MTTDMRETQIIRVCLRLGGVYVALVLSILPMREVLEPLILKLADQYEKELPRPGCNEIKGMAKALDIDIGELVLENILYDVTAFKNSPLLTKSKRGVCTSIVAEDKNGTIWHARNLDYGVINQELSEVLKNITMQVEFYRKGKVAYTATTYAGLTGLYTAQKTNAYTVTIDERNTGSVIENILTALLENNVSLTSQLVRSTFETANTFSEAVKLLSDTPTPAPSYFIVGGIHPGEGAVITKDRIKAADVWYLNTTQKRWYLVETNYDHWKPAPTSDDRRDAAIKAMDEQGQINVNSAGLFKVLSTHPVLNPSTTYTTMMSAAHPEVYQTWIREGNST